MTAAPKFITDPNGDLRTEEEMPWPIKAQCRWCGGVGRVPAEPFMDGVRLWKDCNHPSCCGRGYYFLPLGN